MKNSRLTKRYGPGGNAGLVSGIARARALTSSSVPSVSLATLSVCEIERADSVHDLGRVDPFRMRDRAPHVLQPRLPVLEHGGTRELVILRARRGVQAAVDQ